MRNRFDSHVRGDKVKWIVTAIVGIIFALAIVELIGYCVTGSWNVAEWGKQAEEELPDAQEPEAPQSDYELKTDEA